MFTDILERSGEGERHRERERERKRDRERQRETERERKREKDGSVASCLPQAPQPGLKPTTFLCRGQNSNQLDHPARALLIIFNS